MTSAKQGVGFKDFFSKGSADYCDFGICDENTEYCCGENKCCQQTVQVWYYWAVVLLVIIIIVIAVYFYMKRLKGKYPRYVQLEQFDGAASSAWSLQP